MSCDVGRRCCVVAATAPIRPLAWEPPYAAGVALEKAKKKKKKEYISISADLHFPVKLCVRIDCVFYTHILKRLLLPTFAEVGQQPK